MIDEKKLIDLLQGGEGSEKYKVEFNYNKEDDIEKIVSDALDAYVTMLIGAIRDMRKEDGWIPCENELPKTNGVYQIIKEVKEGNVVYHIEGAAYFDGQNTWYNDVCINHGRGYLVNIIAWQPIQPYRE